MKKLTNRARGVSESASLDGKVVVITGGARGIGLATATALNKLGARVAIGDIDEHEAKESGGRSGVEFCGKLDVTDQSSFAGFLDEVESRMGPIDVLINNAGICPAGKIVDEPDSVTRRTLEINVYGVILGTKLAGQRMLKRGGGHIVNVASAIAGAPSPGVASYSATKCAVVGFTEAVRTEFRGTGVHFSTVMPTLTNTDLVAGVARVRGLKNADPTDIADAIVALIKKPRRRVVVPPLVGALLMIERVAPRAVSEALERAFGLDHLFVDVDAAERKSYEERVRTAC